MITITKISPPFIKIEGLSDEQLQLLKDKLSYTDNKAVFAYQRFKKNRYLANKMDPEDFTDRLNELKAAQKKSLVINKKGEIYTYSGLLSRVVALFQDCTVVDKTTYPESKLLPFLKVPPQKRHYQDKSVKALLEAKHGAISVCTGGGKSLILINLAAELGLKTTIMCPTASIAKQLYDSFLEFFGKKYVGLYGSGKKEFKKQFVVAIDKSLINLEKGTPEYEEFSKTEVAIVDESHMVATETQETVMCGVLKKAPYRFFLSATQFRNDGADLLLEGITGNVVYEYSLQQAVKEGFLADPTFYIIPVKLQSTIYKTDTLQILAEGVYQNRDLHSYAAKIANKALREGKNVMVMVDHIDQFSLLVNHFETPPEFAYGSLTKDQKKSVPEKYHNIKSSEAVERFNSGKSKLLVGTGAIGMGTDTRPVDVIINLQGGKSDVKFLQLIGRGTRKVPGKDSFSFVDFDIKNNEVLHRMSLSRKALYESITNNVYTLENGI